MTKELQISEEYQDYMVKDYKTFPKSHSKYLKSRTKLLMKGIETRVKVKSVTNPSMEWDKDKEVWNFKADIKIKLFD